MKSKDLIKVLQELDPCGENEVLINNKDIDYIITQPMFSDKYGHLITKRSSCNQPEEISIKSTGSKINLKPIDTFEYYRSKILNDQKFIEVNSTNSNLILESCINFKKILNLNFCKTYLQKSNLNLYPYKLELILKIDEEIRKVKSKFNFSYLRHLKDNFSEEESVYFELFFKIRNCNDNIILNPIKKDKKIVIIETTNMPNFYFEIINNKIINLVQKNNKNILVETNINLETFNFNYYLGDQWQKEFDLKINRAIFNDQFI